MSGNLHLFSGVRIVEDDILLAILFVDGDGLGEDVKGSTDEDVARKSRDYLHLYVDCARSYDEGEIFDYTKCLFNLSIRGLHLHGRVGLERGPKLFPDLFAHGDDGAALIKEAVNTEVLCDFYADRAQRSSGRGDRLGQVDRDGAHSGSDRMGGDTRGRIGFSAVVEEGVRFEKAVRDAASRDEVAHLAATVARDGEEFPMGDSERDVQSSVENP
jgi:hypothetical protein